MKHAFSLAHFRVWKHAFLDKNLNTAHWVQFISLKSVNPNLSDYYKTNKKINFIKVSIALYQLELLGKFPYILECDYHLQIRYLRAGANKQNWLWIIGLMFSSQIIKLKMYLCLFSYSEVRCDLDFNSIQLLTEVRNKLYNNIKFISPLFD